MRMLRSFNRKVFGRIDDLERRSKYGKKSWDSGCCSDTLQGKMV